MQKKAVVTFGILMLMGISITSVMANSTIYTDDIGRMHFLGKDPGAKTLQKVEDYSNPAVKDVTNAVSNVEQAKPVDNVVNKVNEVNVNEQKVNHTNKAKGSFTSTKGSMDASNPYMFGGSNIDTTKPQENLSKKRFWQIW